MCFVTQITSISITEPDEGSAHVRQGRTWECLEAGAWPREKAVSSTVYRKQERTGGNLEVNTDALLGGGEEGEIWQVKDGKKRGEVNVIPEKNQEGCGGRGHTTEEKLEEAETWNHDPRKWNEDCFVEHVSSAKAEEGRWWIKRRWFVSSNV